MYTNPNRDVCRGNNSFYLILSRCIASTSCCKLSGFITACVYGQKAEGGSLDAAAWGTEDCMGSSGPAVTWAGVCL